MMRVLQLILIHLKSVILYLGKSVYRPLDKQKIYTNCSDAMVKGGIVPNPGQPVSIIFKVNVLTIKLG